MPANVVVLIRLVRAKVSTRWRSTILVLAATCSTLALAMWAPMNDAELIQRSDFVVLGQWVGHADVVLAETTPVRRVGVIVVSEVLKGPEGQQLAMVALPAASTLRASDELSFKAGDRGLWLLRLPDPKLPGLYVVDHPQRFVRSGAADAKIDALRKQLRP